MQKYLSYYLLFYKTKKMGYSTSVVYGTDFSKLGKDKKKPLIPTNKILDLKTKTVNKTKNKTK